MHLPPPPGLFALGLWNQRLAGWVWLQSPDFRAFAGKVSGMSNLGIHLEKEKGCEINSGYFLAGMMVWFVGVAGISTAA
jgi:hypothetical protein